MHQVCKDKIEELSLMADGMLSIEKVEELEKHLSSCPTCSRYYSDIKAMKSSLSTLTIEAPENINELIGKAIRKAPSKKNYKRYIYRYATIAAACLVLVVFFVSRGLFNSGADKAYESAELRGMENAAAPEINSDMAFLSDSDDQLDSYVDASKTVASTEEMLQVAPKEDGNIEIYGSLSEYRYVSSAIENENFVIVNPEGLPLDSGYGGMQDIFYASGAFTIDEMASILAKEFNISDIVIENENLFFYINQENLQKLESRLVLVSSDKFAENKNSISIRIVSVQKSDKE